MEHCLHPNPFRPALPRPVPPPPTASPARPAAPDSGALLLAAVTALSAQHGRQGAALVQMVVRAWWQALDTGLDLAPPPALRGAVALDAGVAAVARDYATVLAPLPVALVADRIGALHAGLMPAEERARAGVYYTPPALADRLVDLAAAGKVDWTTARVLDPAAGCGAFLVPVALRMAAALKGVEPAIAARSIATRLRGLELDPMAAWISGVMVEAALLPLLRGTGQRLSPCLAADALAVPERAEFDLVIGNPPYGRLTLEPALRARFARSLYGHANLYGLFMDLAVRLAAPGGLIAFLTPSSFLAGDYFKHLRRTLTELAPPVSLDFVDERRGVFDNVLQETVLATYRRAGGRRRRPPRALVNMIRAGGGGGDCPSGRPGPSPCRRNRRPPGYCRAMRGNPGWRRGCARWTAGWPIGAIAWPRAPWSGTVTSRRYRTGPAAVPCPLSGRKASRRMAASPIAVKRPTTSPGSTRPRPGMNGCWSAGPACFCSARRPRSRRAA
ncbi:HsdM family class I SAM-dependent methyltransferase [Niveispirillum fermenti]|uniref:HsdM family class I SAM-dependent methyltransferase n=1 Tax=Niveispirillum fermenti TaxID=1233113 RepID=UPI00404124C7